MMNSPSASVIIPTRDRPQALECCLDALAAQMMPPGSFEVIVVDDGSAPPLSLDPLRWARKFELKLIHQQNTGPAGARNRGVAEARGEFIAFTDDDCLPTPGWLGELVAKLRENPNAMVGGSTFNGLKSDRFAETSQFVLELVYEHFNRNPEGAYFFASNNIACRREHYMSIGGFDAEFDFPGAEDREFCDRWRMQGRSMLWQKSALIEHRHGQSLMAFIRLHFRYGQGAYLYQAKRKLRGSGTMLNDLGFHLSLPASVLRKTSNHRVGTRLSIVGCLILWQLANAGGFLWSFTYRK
jgi:glycosyltransferase involved in cell wall biosynthesis